MLLVFGAVFAFLAAVVHLGIFLLESVFWPRPAVWRRFGLRSQGDAEIVRPMAFNQGFYNVFLALGAGIGLVLLGVPGAGDAGTALVLFALASMALAAVVLVASRPRLWRAALAQGVAPALGLVVTVVALSL